LPGGYRETVAIVGRQSGKTRVAAMVAVFEAITATEEAGAELSALLVAQDHRAAPRTLFKYASAPFDLVPMLKSTVVTRTADTITLTNGVAISAYPCRPQAIRGLRSRVTVCDELAFFRSSEGFPTDTEMLRALRPTLVTTGGKLIVLSSP
jgi:phage terminase large subunit-like protein